jgi:hypothetical protein
MPKEFVYHSPFIIVLLLCVSRKGGCYSLNSILMPFSYCKTTKSRSHCHIDVLSTCRVYHWTCLLVSVWSLHAQITRKPKHFYLDLTLLFFLLIPKPLELLHAPKRKSSFLRLPSPLKTTILPFCLCPTHAALPHTKITAYLNVILQNPPM